MNELKKLHDIDMEGIVQALETAPDVGVPNDFAARVMASLPPRPQRRFVLRHPLPNGAHLGRSVAFAALLILVAGMLVLAPRTSGSPTWLLVQGLLFAQLAALLLWMGITFKRVL